MEKKESALVGKHYLMKQAFGQDELHEREAVCTRTDPPPCMAACPLGIDMRSVCDHAAKGDFSKAAEIIRMSTPFLYTLSGNCSGECENRCTLSRLGDGVRLRALERACAMYGGSGAVSRFMLPKKQKKTAVIGDDLFALACCWELGKKGYEVSWHTSCGSLVEPLLRLGLPEAEAKADLTALQNLRILRKEEKALSIELIEKVSEEADAVCISPDPGLACQKENCFAGRKEESVAGLLASAKRTALLADCFLQGAGTPPEEENRESRLFVTMDGVEGSESLLDPEHVTKEKAAAEAARCIQCQCTECIKGCVYLQHYKRNPRAAIREIYNNLSIVMGNHMANGLINACDECGQCRAACPNGFDYPDVCRIARHTMVETKKMPPSAHEFALLDQQFSNGEAFLARKQPGFEKCRYVFFPGCQASAVSPDTVEAAYRDLSTRLEGGVGLILGCCGAVSEWAAREDLLAEAEERFRSAWEEMGRPAVICACPTCRKIFDRYFEAKTVGIWEILLKLGVKPLESRPAAVHDACGARGDKKTQEEVRALARALGCRVTEAPFSGDLSPCCGFGGLVKYANPQMAREKADFAAGRADGMIVTYCMACKDQFARTGAGTRHILELVYGTGDDTVPDLSRRRKNRLELKQKLLREIWKEDMRMEEMLPVRYAQGAMEEMEDRMILKSDVDAVLRAYEESGAAVFDQEHGWLVTCHRLGNVTFWVKFRKEEDGYLVFGAYSHRMTVE